MIEVGQIYRSRRLSYRYAIVTTRHPNQSVEYTDLDSADGVAMRGIWLPRSRFLELYGLV